MRAAAALRRRRGALGPEPSEAMTAARQAGASEAKPNPGCPSSPAQLTFTSQPSPFASALSAPPAAARPGQEEPP